ncbi:MAG: hypothetical protein EA402_07770 [Planctomycetota bacterium]|nr:MAG: hypothetical protein EA402_07770 [Planctomycetota bacterium]
MTDEFPAAPEPGFAELEAEGWTDLHLHPTDSRWSLPLAEVPALLRRLGAQRLGLLTLHSVEDLWDDAADIPDPLLEREDVSIEELSDLLARDDIRHLSAVIDPAQTTLLPLIAHCQTAEWHACLLSFGWGLTTIPDPDCQRTAARFRCSLAVGGPGVPAAHAAFARSAVQSEAVRQAIAQVGEWFATPCTATVTFGE